MFRLISPSRVLVGVIVPMFVISLTVPSIVHAQSGTLFVEGDQVGIGTDAPTADLEILDDDFGALRLTSTQGLRTWAFSSTPNGDFTVNLIGSGGQEFSVNARNNGDGKSTMIVQGSVQGTNFVSSSSRELKTDFSLLDGKEILSRLAGIPMMSWRYKTEAGDVQHFGPMAEDFHAAFGVGPDAQHITSIDADGVALAAIQGLYATVQEKDAEIDELKTRLAQLESLVASLAAK